MTLDNQLPHAKLIPTEQKINDQGIVAYKNHKRMPFLHQ